MYKSGKLNTTNEFYYYVGYYKLKYEIDENTKSYIKIIADKNYLNYSKFSEFIELYYKTVFDNSKNVWMHNYEIDNKLIDEKDVNYFEKAKKNFLFPTYI